MARAWRKHWIGGLIGLAFLLGMASVISLWRDIGRPFGGFVTSREVLLTGDQWTPEMSTPPWWPGLAQSGLRVGDVLVLLDGRPYGRRPWEAYAAAYARGDASISLTINKNGATVETRAPVVPFTLAHFFDLKMPGLINGFGFWLLALVVYRAGSTNVVNRLFAVICTLIAIHRWEGFPGVFLNSSLLADGLELVNPFVAPFIGALLIHFVLTFPQPSRWRPPVLVDGLYALAFVMSAAFVASRLMWWRSGWTPLIARLERFGYFGSLILLGVGVIFFLLRYAWLLLLSGPTPRLRRQLLFILAGMMLSLPVVVLLIMNGFSRGVHFFWNGLNLRYLLLAMPMAFAYVIVRYQTFRSSGPLFMSVFILAGSALLASIGDWAMRLARPQLASAFILPPFVPIFGGILIISAFWSTQFSWRGIFGRLLHWEERSYAAVRRFGQRVIGQTDLALLPQAIAAALVSELELEQAAVWL